MDAVVAPCLLDVQIGRCLLTALPYKLMSVFSAKKMCYYGYKEREMCYCIHINHSCGCDLYVCKPGFVDGFKEQTPSPRHFQMQFDTSPLGCSSALVLTSHMSS